MQQASIMFVGGTRSGKSGLALRWAEEVSPKRLFVATLEATDAEMGERVLRHQEARGASWELCEAGGSLGAKLGQILELANPPGVVLIDCLSTWVSLRFMEASFEQELEDLARLISQFSSPLALVTTETGLGVVPPTPLGRKFRDALGDANQRLAQVFPTVIFVSCGLPLVLKGQMPAVFKV